MKPNDLRRELDALDSELTYLERRIRAARVRCARVRRALPATPALPRVRPPAAPSGRMSAMEAPGHVIDAVAAVSRRGGAVDARTLARLLRVTPPVAGARLQRAARLGLLRRVGRGQYTVGT